MSVDGVGVKFPFKIAGGSVLMASSHQELVKSRIMFCLGTQVGERVMRPNWGIDIMNVTHAMGGSIEEVVREAVDEAFRQWFPDYVLKEMRLEYSAGDPTRVEILVRYGKSNSLTDESARVGTTIDGGAEMF